MPIPAPATISELAPGVRPAATMAGPVSLAGPEARTVERITHAHLTTPPQPALPTRHETHPTDVRIPAVIYGRPGAMKAIVQRRYGGAETLELAAIDPPTLGARQVLVQVRAAGVDCGVYHLMRGMPYVMRLMGFGLRRPKTPVPGLNLAGVVKAAGSDVTRFTVGDEVYGTARGSFAELAAADDDHLAAKPAELSFEGAAVLPYPATVALQAIRDRAEVRPGQSVLVVGASGAVGTIAVQIARAHGAEVTGVCHGTNAEFVKHLGASRTISHDQDDLARVAGRHDVVIDIGGNTSTARLRQALAKQGTLVIIGGEGGGPILGGVHPSSARNFAHPSSPRRWARSSLATTTTPSKPSPGSSRPARFDGSWAEPWASLTPPTPSTTSTTAALAADSH